MNKRVIYLVLLVFVFVLYGNSIKNKYSLDDHLVNEKNELTQHGFKGIPAIFSQHSFNEKELSYSYRPVFLSTFAIEYAVFGTHPHVSHFISICLYALLVLLLFRFLSIVFKEVSSSVIFIAVLLFAAHPLHTEAVANIKSRDELLVAIFGFSALIHYFSYLNDEKKYRILLIVLFLVAGYLCKQTILVYAALIPILHLYNYFKTKKKSSKVIIVGAGILVFAFFCIKIIRMYFLDMSDLSRRLLFYENPLVDSSFFDRIAAGSGIILHNLKMLFYPSDLSYYYGYDQIPVSGWSDLITYLGMFVIALIIYMAIRSFRINFFFSIAMIMILLNLAAVSNVFVLLPGIAAERFLILGSVGVCMLISFGLNLKIESLKSVFAFGYKLPRIVIFLTILIAMSVRVHSRNKVWKDEFSLISNDVKHLSRSAKAQDLMAFQLYGKAKLVQDPSQRMIYIDEAIKHCYNCLYIYPEYITCWNNMGTLFYAKGDFQKAEVCFKRTLEIDRTDANPLFNLGNIYLTKQKPLKAYEYYCLAIERNPDLFDLIPVFKQVVIRNNLLPEGISFTQKMIEKHPENYDLLLLMTDFYLTQNDNKNALVYLKRANKMRPSAVLAGYIEKITTFIEDKH